MARTVTRPLPTPDPLARDMAALGMLVRNRRAQSELGIVDAADQLGVSKSALSRLENGKPVNLDMLFRVLEGLGLSMLVVTKNEALKAVRVLRPSQEA
ncbi:helix-turn-helix domain-containing protein [Paraburkholderia sp. HP33-1]|uniref:helix-turn-helix domain-containing protein n=1 Tax=Paraburkholderia sp. HP33-1 TaxID=2883243 RepID=UPI001F468442|nr:helix-turn-helix domain-containing protein [Paraburkholderia sp. HP33-1]